MIFRIPARILRHAVLIRPPFPAPVWAASAGAMITSSSHPAFADRLSQAAVIRGKHPAALRLLYLRTLREAALKNNSTTLFPTPIDLFKPFTEMTKALKKSTGGAIDRGSPSEGKE